MTTPKHNQVILLRGVNVNGITVKSVPLRASMESIAGVERAKTLLASGNVVVHTAIPEAELKAEAEAALRRDFGYDAWVVVLPQASLARLLENIPWRDDDPARHIYLTFASETASLDEIAEAASAAGFSDQLARPASQVLAWLCPVGASTDAPLAKLFAKARYKSTTTTRNLRTVAKLAALSV